MAKRKGKKTIFILIPMVFMLSMTLWALVQLIYQSGFTSIGIISAILLVLAVVLVIEAVRIVFFRSMPVVSK
jgi:carbon starvation protein CstA